MKTIRFISALVIAFSLFFITGCDSKEMKNAKDCMNIQQYDKAIGYIETEINNNPTNAEAYVLKGSMLIRIFEVKKAKKSFDTALQIDPNIKDDLALDCIKNAIWLEKENRERTYPISVALLEYAKEINPQKEEAIKNCFEDLGMIAIKGKRLRASIEYLMAREKYGKDKNLEFAKIYYNLPLTGLHEKAEALEYACHFDEKYKPEIAESYIKLAQKELKYSKAIGYIELACKIDTKYEVEREKTRRRIAAYHTKKHEKDSSISVHNNFKFNIIPLLTPTNQKTIFINEGETKVIKVEPFMSTPKINLSTSGIISIESAKPFYAWYYTYSKSMFFYPNGKLHYDGGIYHGIYAINLNNEAVEFKITVK